MSDAVTLVWNRTNLLAHAIYASSGKLTIAAFHLLMYSRCKSWWKSEDVSEDSLSCFASVVTTTTDLPAYLRQPQHMSTNRHFSLHERNASLAHSFNHFSQSPMLTTPDTSRLANITRPRCYHHLYYSLHFSQYPTKKRQTHQHIIIRECRLDISCSETRFKYRH
jgi:hypothetical protein